MHKIYTKKLVFMRVAGVLQGRLFNKSWHLIAHALILARVRTPCCLSYDDTCLTAPINPLNFCSTQGATLRGFQRPTPGSVPGTGAHGALFLVATGQTRAASEHEALAQPAMMPAGKSSGRLTTPVTGS